MFVEEVNSFEISNLPCEAESLTSLLLLSLDICTELFYQSYISFSRITKKFHRPLFLMAPQLP